ncbi:MAG: protein-export chaperone SecB [Ruminococcus sp.]|nr:protein-export chaperone SecB [Candidatus Copronaster equi]
MKNLKMNAYKIEEVNFINKVKGNKKIELKNSYSYNVRYTNNNICEGRFTVTINDKESPENFAIKVVLVGIFTFEDGMEREIIHIQTYKELFPYARAFVTNITANAGIQPIMIPDMDIENREIYRFDNPNNVQ